MAKIVEIETWEQISTERLPDGWLVEDYEQVGYKTDLKLYRQHVRYYYWDVGGWWHFSHAETISEEEFAPTPPTAAHPDERAGA